MISQETLLRAAQALQSRVNAVKRTLESGELPNGKRVNAGHVSVLREGMENDQKALDEIHGLLPEESKIVNLNPQ